MSKTFLNFAIDRSHITSIRRAAFSIVWFDDISLTKRHERIFDVAEAELGLHVLLAGIGVRAVQVYPTRGHSAYV